MRKLLLIFLLPVLLVVPLASAQGDPATGALEWLAEQQIEDGSLGQNTTNTATAAIAFGMIGEPNADAISWLAEDVTAHSDDYSLDEASFTVLAVAASGEDATAFADGALMASFMGQLQAQRGEDVLNLCLGLVALHATGAELPPTALSGVSALQEDDGHFPTLLEGELEADVAGTAVCAHVLVLMEDEEAVASAVSYLADAQNEDGGWGFGPSDGESLGVVTSLVLNGLTAAGEDLQADWGSAVGYLFGQRTEDGGFAGFGDDEGDAPTTALTALVFRGLSLNDVGASEDGADMNEDEGMGDDDMGDDSAMLEEGPALDPNWLPVADGFSMEELDTADDFFVTVIDPFTEEELSGVEIINWVAEYTYTGYIIEGYLPADVMLWMADQDPAFWDNLSDAVLELLPEDVLSQLPEDVQGRVE
jgi:hypothetical protein